MARRFHVETPTQLLALQEFAKDGNITRAASIWNTARKKKGSKGTPWDKGIVVDFCAFENRRTAIVFLLGDGNRSLLSAHLRYNPALQWCKAHLKEIM